MAGYRRMESSSCRSSGVMGQCAAEGVAPRAAATIVSRERRIEAPAEEGLPRAVLWDANRTVTGGPDPARNDPAARPSTTGRSRAVEPEDRKTNRLRLGALTSVDHAGCVELHARPQRGAPSVWVIAAFGCVPARRRDPERPEVSGRDWRRHCRFNAGQPRPGQASRTVA